MRTGSVQAIVLTLSLVVGLSSIAIFSDDISFSSSYLPKLGTAYSSLDLRMLGAACVDGNYEEFSGTQSKFVIKNNSKFSSVEKTLKGSLGITLGKDEIGDIKGTLDYVKSSKTNSRNMVQSLVVEFSPKPIRLTTYRSALPNFGDVPAAVVASRVKRSCGDSYVAELSYAGVLVATFKVKFESSEVKSDIGGRIDLALTGVGDILNIDGGLNSLTDSQKGKVAIEVSARQLGGDQTMLSSVLPEGTMTCEVENVKPCEEAYRKVINYARTQMANQYRTLEDYYPVKARTVLYEDNIFLWEISDLINYN